VVGAGAAGAVLHLAERPTVADGAGAGSGIQSAAQAYGSGQSAQVASRAWALLLRPVVQLGLGLAWSASAFTLISQSEEQEEQTGQLLLHPLVVYLAPVGLGSLAVWFALE